MEKHTIYKYIKVDTNEVVYIGRTNNLARRRKEHEIYEPREKSRPHYNYPLSRGIRKYGLQNYKCEIIESGLDFQRACEREQYWIKFYDTYEDPSKYNYSPGGEYITEPKFNDIIIDEVKSLLEDHVDYATISDRTGVSIPHISEINTGKRRRDDDRTYPINELTAGRKLTTEEVNEIIQLLKTTQRSCADIGRQYNVTGGAIQAINSGKNFYNSNIAYPIRKKVVQHKYHRLTKDEIEQLYKELMDTDTNFNELANKYQVSLRTIYNINQGVTHKRQTYLYPLRK